MFVTAASLVPLPEAFRSFKFVEMMAKFAFKSVRLLEKVERPTKNELWLVVTAPLSKSSVKTASEQLRLLNAGPTLDAFTNP